MSWGVFEIWTEDGEDTQEIHIVPMVRMDGDEAMSEFHTLDHECPCIPTAARNKWGILMWNHHDPDHPGSSESEE